MMEMPIPVSGDLKKDEWFQSWLQEEMKLCGTFQPRNEGIQEMRYRNQIDAVVKEVGIVYVPRERRLKLLEDDYELKEFLATTPGKDFDENWPQYLAANYLIYYADQWVDKYSAQSLDIRLRENRRMY